MKFSEDQQNLECFCECLLQGRLQHSDSHNLAFGMNKSNMALCAIGEVRLLKIIQYCSGDKIEKNEMGGACSEYEREDRPIQGFSGET